MRYITKFLLLSLIVIFSSGCTSYFKRSATTITDLKGDPIGTIFVWDPDSNAALLKKDGSVCMQNALAIKTSDTAISAKLSDALVELTKASVELSGDEAKRKDLASITTSIKQTATLLTTTTERTAFLNTGMFYICQLSANEKLSNTEVFILTTTLIQSAAGLNDFEAATSDNISSVSKLIDKVESK